MESKPVSEFPYPKLLEQATKILSNSYCPYSNFSVAAALLCDDEKIFSGCNVENASYGLTNCAERTAIFNAVSEGYRKFKAIVIVTSCKSDEFVGPCGACRQVLAEYGLELEVYITNRGGNFVKTSVAELLPYAFVPESLKKC